MRGEFECRAGSTQTPGIALIHERPGNGSEEVVTAAGDDNGKEIRVDFNGAEGGDEGGCSRPGRAFGECNEKVTDAELNDLAAVMHEWRDEAGSDLRRDTGNTANRFRNDLGRGAGRVLEDEEEEGIPAILCSEHTGCRGSRLTRHSRGSAGIACGREGSDCIGGGENGIEAIERDEAGGAKNRGRCRIAGSRFAGSGSQAREFNVLTCQEIIEGSEERGPHEAPGVALRPRGHEVTKTADKDRAGRGRGRAQRGNRCFDDERIVEGLEEFEREGGASNGVAAKCGEPVESAARGGTVGFRHAEDPNRDAGEGMPLHGEPR